MNRRAFLALIPALAIAPKVKSEPVHYNDRLCRWKFKDPTTCGYPGFLPDETIFLSADESLIHLLPGDRVTIKESGKDQRCVVQSVEISSDGEHRMVVKKLKPFGGFPKFQTYEQWLASKR